MASLADLVVSLTAKTSGFENSIRRATDTARRGMGDIRESVDRVESSVVSAGRVLRNFAAIVGVGFSLDQVIQNTIRQEQAIKQLNATIASTGGAAGLTSQELQDMASSLQTITNFGDEATIEAQSLLLTFTKIGGDVFPRATEAMLDLSTAMDQSLKTSAIQVGKALNDPIAGLGSLSKAGIQFTEDQKELIKALTETGQVAEAQKLILKELEAQFGGSAKAARETLGGALESLGNAFGDLLEFGPGTTEPLRKSLELITANIENIVKTTLILASAALPALLAKVASSALAAAQAMKALAIAMATNPIGLIAVGISTAVAAFFLFRDEAVKVGDTVATVGDFVTATWQETGGRLITIAQKAWEGVSDETIGFLDVAKQVGADIIDVFVGTWKATIQDAKTLINNLVGLFVAVGQSIGVVAGAIVSAFRNAFSNVSKLASAFWQGLQNVFSGDIGFDAFRQQLTDSFVNPMTNAVNEVKERFSSAFSADYVGIVGEGIGKAADEAKLALSDLGTSIQKNAAESRKAREEANKLTGAITGAAPPIAKLGDSAEKAAEGLGKAGKATKALKEKAEELSPALKAVGEDIIKQRDIYKSIDDSYKQHIANIEDERRKLTLSTEEYRAGQLVREGFNQAQIETILSGEKLNETLAENTNKVAENSDAQQAFIDSVAGAFDSLWSDMIQGSKSAAEAVYDTIKSLLLGIAQTILKNKIVIPIATALSGGTATAGGLSSGGGIGNLFGGTGIGDTFENLGASIFGTGPGNNPLFGAGGVSNLQFGISGILGGILGDKLFGGYGGIGGSLGATAGTAIGGALSAGLTGALAIAIPGLGALLGAALGGALGGLFGKGKPSNKAAFGTIDLGTLETTKSAFTGKKAASEETLAIRDAFLDTIAATVRGIEQLGGEALGKLSLDIGEREGVQANFGLGGGVEQFGKDAESALEGIIERIVQGAEGLSEPFKQLIILADGVEDTLKQIESLSIIQQVLDSNPFEDYAKAVEQSQQSLWDAAIAQRDATLQLVNAYDGSVAATQELAIATQQSYQAIIAVIAQIDQLAQGISDSFSSSIESIQLSILDTEQKYEFYRAKATEAFASLQSAVDPQEIARAAQEFEKYANAAFNLIPEENRKDVADQFIEAFQKAEEIAQAGFQEAREATKQAAEEMKIAIQEAFVEVTARLDQSGDKHVQAADKQIQAANTKQQIEVEVVTSEAGY